MSYFPALRSALAVVALACTCCLARADDVAIIDRPVSAADKRGDYMQELLRKVLERTKAEYGPYRIERAPMSMERARLLHEMQLGEIINVTSFPANGEWDGTLKPVPIPVDLGMLSWRLLLIDAKNQSRLQQLAASGQFKQATAGAGSAWEFLNLLQQQGYPTRTGNNYEGLFDMLRTGRFDYLPRGVGEIFPEHAARKNDYPALAVEKHILLHGRIGLLFYVAPTAQRLYKRISAGMNAMLKDGSLEQFMLNYYRSDLQRARLCERIRIDLPNDALPAALQSQPQLWFDPFTPRHGLCRGVNGGR